MSATSERVRAGVSSVHDTLAGDDHAGVCQTSSPAFRQVDIEDTHSVLFFLLYFDSLCKFPACVFAPWSSLCSPPVLEPVPFVLCQLPLTSSSTFLVPLSNRVDSLCIHRKPAQTSNWKLKYFNFYWLRMWRQDCYNNNTKYHTRICTQYDIAIETWSYVFLSITCI